MLFEKIDMINPPDIYYFIVVDEIYTLYYGNTEVISELPSVKSDEINEKIVKEMQLTVTYKNGRIYLIDPNCYQLVELEAPLYIEDETQKGKYCLSGNYKIRGCTNESIEAAIAIFKEFEIRKSNYIMGQNLERFTESFDASTKDYGLSATLENIPYDQFKASKKQYYAAYYQINYDTNTVTGVFIKKDKIYDGMYLQIVVPQDFVPKVVGSRGRRSKEIISELNLNYFTVKSE